MTVRTPGTPASKIDRTPATTPGGPKAKEDKIVVTVRLRPLNKKEQLAKDQVAWKCIDDQTIVFKPPTQERTPQSTTPFTFVFGPTSLTESVYEDGVKNVALSALMGINATIFAYGQTSSGKTYTMRGITEKAVHDIYNHIINTPQRDFTIKISGLEIYNENVRDLLNSDSGRNLKLLDDPEKGTVVEKLVEETTSNDQHLRHLISICEAQRQVGETFTGIFVDNSFFSKIEIGSIHIRLSNFNADGVGNNEQKVLVLAATNTPYALDQSIWGGNFSRYHLMHYIKKCHMKILKRKDKKKVMKSPTHWGIQSGASKVIKLEELQQTDKPTSPKDLQIVDTKETALVLSNPLNNIPKDSDLYATKRNEALRKYEILVELEKKLSPQFSKRQNLQV